MDAEHILEPNLFQSTARSRKYRTLHNSWLIQKQYPDLYIYLLWRGNCNLCKYATKFKIKLPNQKQMVLRTIK